MMRRRDESVVSNTTNNNTNCRDHHGGAGTPCCLHRKHINGGGGGGGGGGAKTSPIGRLRLCLAASALALCAVTFLLQDTFGRAEGGAAVGAARTKAKASADANGEMDLDSLPYRLDDGGPGPPWVPPSERPIPLDAFPIFNGHGFKANGNLDLVDEEVAMATVAAAVPGGGFSSSSSGSGGAVNWRNEEGGPAAMGEVGVTTSTLLFMHIWKCAGSSLRHLLRDWASLKGQDIGVVDKETICMQRHALVNETLQAPYVRLKQVVAGHFTWGFQKHVRQPYVMFTTLRNPLELFVSGQQYLHRKESKHFAHAVSLVEETMKAAITIHILRGGVMTREGVGNAKSVGFLNRLVDPEDEGPKTLDEATREAKEHLDTFWLVGVIEQYEGFFAVLKHMLDPLKSERKLWHRYKSGKYNTSPQGAGKVLAAIDPVLVQQFNDTLSHQWNVYSHAVELYKHRCKQMLHTRELHLCEVPVAPSQYTLTDLELAELDPDRAEPRQPGGTGALTDLEIGRLQLERKELELGRGGTVPEDLEREEELEGEGS